MGDACCAHDDLRPTEDGEGAARFRAARSAPSPGRKRDACGTPETVALAPWCSEAGHAVLKVLARFREDRSLLFPCQGCYLLLFIL